MRPSRFLTTSFAAACLVALCLAGPASAQTSDEKGAPPSTGSSGWRKLEDQSSAAMRTDAPPPAANAPDQQAASPERPAEPNYGTIPPRLTIKPGTYITVRTNQTLSSSKSQQGDSFTATLTQPIVVDGVVVAQRGQTVGGRVNEADKGSRGRGASRLAVEITDLTTVDGQQIPVQSQLVARKGPSSLGDDTGTVITTTGVGAAIGAIADGGAGAGIGAGAGAAAGLAGVLLSRGRPAVIYPESILTFRLQAPVVVSTERAPQVFRFVNPDDYSAPPSLQARRERSEDSCSDRRCIPPYYFGYYPYSYWGPYYWGSPWGYGWGPTFYFGRSYYHRGYGGHFRHR